MERSGGRESGRKPGGEGREGCGLGWSLSEDEGDGIDLRGNQQERKGGEVGESRSEKQIDVVGSRIEEVWRKAEKTTRQFDSR